MRHSGSCREKNASMYLHVQVACYPCIFIKSETKQTHKSWFLGWKNARSSGTTSPCAIDGKVTQCSVKELASLRSIQPLGSNALNSM